MCSIKSNLGGILKGLYVFYSPCKVLFNINKWYIYIYSIAAQLSEAIPQNLGK